MQESRPIQVKDIVLHELSGLYYICENNKQAHWMNENPYYKIQPPNIVPKSYFQKNTK